MRLPRVLVVDDEPLLLETIASALGGRAHVSATVHPREALARIEAGERYEVILIDVRMPGMDGFELFDRIGAVCRSQAQRVMFMVGGALPGGGLGKPVDVAVLEAISHERGRR